ncbi:MAG: hypothetical protein M1825_000143 [Sarcosagium campestre]|nr:MAG: hypothetical protein M1825_000143 [Sarcosagium campestre]
MSTEKKAIEAATPTLSTSIQPEMADKVEAHKRTKSSMARSLLHRDKDRSRGEGGSVDGSQPSGSALSLNSSHVGLGSDGASTSPTRTSLNPNRDSTSSSRPSVPPTSAPGGSVIDKSPSIEQSVRTFRTFEALRSGDSAAVSKAVLETSASKSSSGALEGTTVLHLAVQCAEHAVVEQIFSIGASEPNIHIDANSRDRDGNTPLHLAAMLGRAPVVRLLLDQPDLDDTLTNYQGRQALDLARNPDISQMLQLNRSLFLDAKVREVRALVAKADRPSLENFEEILSESRVQTMLDINGSELTTDPATSESGGTLLHEAARKKDLRLIELLLLNGADPFRRDRKGKLPQDVTKDEKTRAVLKKSPAAAAAQRGIQEKAILGSAASSTFAASGAGENALAGKEGREMKGYLKKWTNYTSGYKLRFFVLEDGVLSYYKHQDDAGSACRGAINMRIAKLHMDPQDKQKFEILGKSSVKYHLKANHVVEAKRWVWALTNAIQWTKDEAKQEASKKSRDSENLRQAKFDQSERGHERAGSEAAGDSHSIHSTRTEPRAGRSLIPGVSATAAGSRVTLGGASKATDGDENPASYEPSLAGDVDRAASNIGTVTIDGELDDDEEYGDDASAREMQPVSKDAFSITAQSARVQLDLLAQVSGAVQAEQAQHPDTPISDPNIVQAVLSYEVAVRNLRTLLGDLLKISRDRDAYWQYRLDREEDVRRLWEDSMARVAKEQEALEDRIGESEIKRKRTKRALRDALEGASGSGFGSRPASREIHGVEVGGGLEQADGGEEAPLPIRTNSLGFAIGRRKSTIAQLANISDSDSDQDEEFFDAIDAGEVEVVDEMPAGPKSPPAVDQDHEPLGAGSRETKQVAIRPSFSGYEDAVRKRLKLDADNRPKIGLWGILKSMIGKDMTKMTLPVSFNEPTSLLQRVAEDMEYTDLLDVAADREDSAERMVHVAAFAASEYASTIGRVAKPFNPLLGETYEYVRPDKGYRFFIEQVSHHPPVGAAYAESPKWDYYGESAVKSKFYGKSFEFNPLGTWFLRLRPTTGGEELYTWKKVTSSVVGIITNNPTVDNYGPMEVKNWTTGETCLLDFKQRGWRAAGAYQVQGKVTNKAGQTVWSIGGHWNDKIYARPGFDGSSMLTKDTGAGSSGHGAGDDGTPSAINSPLGASSTQAFLVWQANARPTGVPFNLTTFCLTLNALPDRLRPHLAPTDTRLRPDQRAMEDGEYDFAATEKNRVEEKQRARRREREAVGEEFTPRWFGRGRCPVTGEEYWEFTGEYWRQREQVGKGGEWTNVEDIF